MRDRLGYFRVGPATFPGTDVSSGSGAALGYRHELVDWALDLSVAWASGTSHEGQSNANSMSLAAEILRVFTPASTGSLYAGGGLSFGSVELAGGDDREGSGPQGELTAGYELAREIRARLGPDTVLLAALSGYGQPQDFEASREAGLDHHLVKPIDHVLLLEVLERVGKTASGQRGD